MRADPALDVLPPVLFNTFKHHAGALRAGIADVVDRGPIALGEIGSRLAAVGTRLMDLYTGALSPRELSAWVRDELSRIGRLDLDRYRDWVVAAGEYAVFTHPADDSRWVLRLGNESGRYVHLHPGRRSPHATRVRANVLKTAFLVLCHTGIHGGDPMSRITLNEVRTAYLGLSPLGADPEGEVGLGAIIDLLRRLTPPPEKAPPPAL